MSRTKPLYLAVAGFAAYIVEQFILAVVILIMGGQFDFFSILLRYILPGALMTAVLMYPAYYLIRIFYIQNWMTNSKSL